MRPIAIVLLALAATGCVSHVQQMRDVRTAFHRGDLAEADRLIAQRLARGAGNADVLALDRAMVALADGRPAEAERLLRQVRDRFDHLEQEDAGETTRAALSDDTAKAYAGEDHEKVLLRGMLALANLLQDGDDAEAYSLQVLDKQRDIIQASLREDGTNPKAAYQQVALAPYLRGILREATHRDYDDAARHFATVVNWQPDFRSGPAHQARAAGGLHSQRGHGVVHVFALVGHGPFKAEVVELPSSLSVMIAGDMLGSGLGRSLPPTLAPIKVPRIVAVPSGVDSVRVAVGDWQAGRTETITNVSEMAVRQQEAVLPETVARAVVRRTLKKGTIFGVKQGLGLSNGSLPAFALDAAGVAWEATENADTRCWSLLPDRIQACRVELPAGPHALTLQPIDRHGRPTGRPVVQEVAVADGRNTYLVLHVPDAGIIGRPLTSPR
jgi:hypothetical protein